MFDVSYVEVVCWFIEGFVDGVCVDYFDGLFDFSGYLV